MKKILVSNWKMNGSMASNEQLMRDLQLGLDAFNSSKTFVNPCTVVVCPPTIYASQILRLVGTNGVMLGSQDVSMHASGAYTGEVSAAMLRDLGIRFAIVGHSERRQHHGETDEQVGLKAQAALACGITPIICVGETLAEREAHQTEAVVRRQLAAAIHAVGHCSSEILVAYEPVWAIGTGKTATPEQAQAVHAILRGQLQAATALADRVPILYGGSMNAANAKQLLAQKDVDGGLVGGASLKATDFLAMMEAASLAAA